MPVTVRIVALGCGLMALLFIQGCSLATLSNHEQSQSVVWVTNFEEAHRLAREKKLPILASFVGSDWCPWCQKMESTIFSQKEFITYAREHYVLFQADFPRHKEQPIKIKEQNEALAKMYSVRKFPTVLLLDGEGKQMARTGFRFGGARAYLDHLESLCAK
jgi:thioredoxin-related protein